MILQNKVAVITGATRGIGKAVLTRFIEEGATVIGLFQNSDELAKQLESELVSKGHTVEFVKGSVSDQDFVADFMKHIKQKYKSIDILINNAGIAKDSLAMMMSLEQWDSVFETNFLGTYHCCNEVIPYMKEQQSGKVVNVISVSGVYGREGQMNYAASKGAIVGLTRMLSRRYSEDGIHFNCIAPGMVETEMIEQVSEAKMNNFLKHTNLKRPGSVQEVANSILFLSSHLSDYVSNTVLKVDGGFMR